MKKDVKVLSVRGWWAHCIIIGAFDRLQRDNSGGMPIVHKDVENRTWSTNYRGRLYIHCSGQPGRGFECQDDNFDTWLHLNKDFEIFPEELKCGHIIGHVDLAEVNMVSTSRWYDGPDFFGKANYAWCLSNPVKIEPIKARGSLSIWNHEIEESNEQP